MSATPWSPAQQAWLQAMGYTVLHGTELAEGLAAEAAAMTASVAMESAVPAADAVVLSIAAAPRAAASAPAPRASADESRPPLTRRAPAPAQDGPPPPATSARAGAATRQPSVRLPDRLQIALLRASGLNPNDPATQTLMDTWPLDTLRGNGAAKRALWPQLRALRRRGGAA